MSSDDSSFKNSASLGKECQFSTNFYIYVSDHIRAVETVGKWSCVETLNSGGLLGTQHLHAVSSDDEELVER